MKKYRVLRFLPISPYMIVVKTLIKTAVFRVELLIFPFKSNPKIENCTLYFNPPLFSAESHIQSHINPGVCNSEMCSESTHITLSLRTVLSHRAVLLLAWFS